MHVRERESLRIDHTTVRISSTSMVQMGVDELCGSRIIPFSRAMVTFVVSGLNPREEDAKCLEFSKIAGGLSFSSR